jgi:iron-sulfur cluster assembly protein
MTIVFTFILFLTKQFDMGAHTAETKHPVTFTPGAISQLKNIFQEQQLTHEHGLRVGVKGGGCSGFSYILGFDTQKEKDEVFEMEGLKVYMEKSHAIYLLGMEIDWHDGLDNRGFTFNNPNAKETCGCGTSFSA